MLEKAILVVDASQKSEPGQNSKGRVQTPQQDRVGWCNPSKEGREENKLVDTNWFQREESGCEKRWGLFSWGKKNKQRGEQRLNWFRNCSSTSEQKNGTRNFLEYRHSKYAHGCGICAEGGPMTGEWMIWILLIVWYCCVHEDEEIDEFTSVDCGWDFWFLVWVESLLNSPHRFPCTSDRREIGAKFRDVSKWCKSWEDRDSVRWFDGQTIRFFGKPLETMAKGIKDFSISRR